MKYNQVIVLRKKGHSIREISRILNLPYSVVQRLCKKVTMSELGKNRYHMNVKGIIKQANIEFFLSKEKVRIMSNLLFDGSVYVSGYHYSVMYVNSSYDLVKQFIDDMFKVYGVNYSSFETHDGKINKYYRVKYISKLIYSDLLKYFNTYSTSDIKCSIPEFFFDNDIFIRTLLRSFWDNEGSISKSGKLSADLKNENVIKQLSRLHNYLKLNHYISRYWKSGWAYKIILNKSRQNYMRFIDLGLFSDSIICKGIFAGKKKRDILQKYFENHKFRL